MRVLLFAFLSASCLNCADDAPLRPEARDTSSPPVVIEPHDAELQPEDSLLFAATVGGTRMVAGDRRLTWTATGGTIDGHGRFRAGRVPGAYRVVVRNQAGKADSALVTVVPRLGSDATPTPASAGTTYYVDATSGFNYNNGLSPSTPWKTLNKVNISTFAPGDVILLKRSETWKEQLTLPSSGSLSQPITIGAYGTGPRPLIDGEGLRPFCISGEGKSHVVVEEIACTRWINSGIGIFQGNNWTIQSSEVFSGGNDSGPDHAIRVWTPDGGALLTEIKVLNNSIGTVNTRPDEGLGMTGIQLQGVEGARIAGNTISTVNTVGVRVNLNPGSPDNVGVLIENNNLVGCFSNLVINNTDDVVIRSNNIRDGKGMGIGLAYDSDNAELYDNTIRNLPEKTPTLWNGIDINHGSDNGYIHDNHISKVYWNAISLSGLGQGWRITNNVLDVTENTELPMPLKIFKGVSWTSDFNTFWNGRLVSIKNVVKNASFEKFTGAPNDGATDTFNGWLNQPATGGAIEAVTAEDAGVGSIPKGRYALVMRRATAGVQTVTRKVRLKPKTVYDLSFSAHSNGSALGKVSILTNPGPLFLQDNGSWSQNPNYDMITVERTETTWRSKKRRFTSLMEQSYTIRVENAFNDGNLYLDKFKLKEIGPAMGEYEAKGARTGGLAHILSDWQRVTGQDANSVFSAP